MSSNQTYPLAALVQIREAACEEAELRLAGAVAAKVATEKAISVTIQESKEAKAEIATYQGRNLEAPDTAIISGRDLALRNEYVMAKGAELAALQTRKEALESELGVLETKCSEAQTQLAETVVELEALQKHHQKWELERRMERMKREEAEAEEVAANTWRSQNAKD